MDDWTIYELSYINDNWDNLNGYPIMHPSLSCSPVFYKVGVCSDASGIGHFVYSLNSIKKDGSYECLAKRPFSVFGKSQSSTYRLLIFIRY